MYFLGFDIGSSSVKATLLNGETGEAVASATSPKTEMKIEAVRAGWAEQDPEMWWQNLKLAVAEIKSKSGVDVKDIKAIGISYQMHGLVVVDKDKKVLRPSIIWCDSRAVEIGQKAFEDLGSEKCLPSFLNSPGNFTASKFKWVKENEPEIFNKVYKFMLPGDYIALKLSGEINTTISGLSEGICWDYNQQTIANSLLNYYGINDELVPEITPTFSQQAQLTESAAKEIGLNPGTSICYRAGDQPNNAFSLNVLNAGEIAATAGTSGVVYGITDKPVYDPKSRVNTFVHVNYLKEAQKYGVLLCINGTGIQNSWLKNSLLEGRTDYAAMNELAMQIKPGSDGVKIYPFGNGAERVLENKEPGGSVKGINFNRHGIPHVLRAAQEGIAFGLNYGMDVMRQMGLNTDIVRAGEANMFLSPVFREVFCNTTGAVVELYNTDGAQGAARGAAVGYGFYKSFKEAFSGLKKLKSIEPKPELQQVYKEVYENWVEEL